MDSRLLDLVIEWEERKERGEGCSPEEIAQHDPALAAMLRQQISKLQRIPDVKQALFAGLPHNVEPLLPKQMRRSVPAEKRLKFVNRGAKQQRGKDNLGGRRQITTGLANTADANLLFGVLALQMDFITRDQLIAGMQRWVNEKTLPLADHLVRLGVLRSDDQAAIEPLIAAHLRRHGNDPQHSLAALHASERIKHELQHINDSDLQHSLLNIPAQGARLDQQATLSVGASSSAGTRFIHLRHYARGGLGEVFVARDTELGREVALKEIQFDKSHDADARARFTREAEITGGLEHPGIVPVYGLGTYPDGRPFYAMRFIRGKSLAEAIKEYHAGFAARTQSEQNLELRRLLQRFMAVCEAIDYAHSRGVLHRDLKPANIMLGRYGETLVVDWGLAKLIGETPDSPKTPSPDAFLAESLLKPSSGQSSDPTQMGSALGTPAYMSPEQAQGRLDVLAPASDIFSLGATLYQLLTGQAPYVGKNVFELMQQAREGKFPPPTTINPSLSKPLEAICTKAMAVDPRGRYATAKELADDLERYLADEPVTACSESALEKLSRWSRKHRQWTQAILASSVLVAVVSIVSTLLVQRARDKELKALKVADKDRTAAEASFQQARQTVDQFFTRVSDSKLLNVPGLQPLRRDLLQDALKYYQGFLAQREGDPHLQAELAATHYRVGLIIADIGTKSDAMQALDTALSIQKTLLKQSPDDLQLRVALGNTLNALGDTVLNMGQHSIALEYFRQAKEQREQAVRVKESDPQLRRKVLNSYDNLAVTQALLGAKHEAVLSYEQANLARARLMLDSPNEEVFKHDLARGLFNLAQLYAELNDLEPALKELRRSADLYHNLLLQHQAPLDYPRELAYVHRLIGDIEMRRGNKQEVSIAFTEARRNLEQLARRNPLVGELKLDLVKLYEQIAQWHRSQGEYEESARLYDQMIVLAAQLVSDDPTVVDYTLRLAAAHLERGSLWVVDAQHEQAAEEFAETIRLVEELAKQGNHAALELLIAARIAVGSMDISRGNFAEAAATLRSAESDAGALSQSTNHASLMAAKVQAQLGVALGLGNNPEEGLKKLQSVVVKLQALRASHPKDREVAVELSDVHARTAELLFMLTQYEQAISELRHSIKLRSEIGSSTTANSSDVLAWGEAVQGLSLVLMEQGKQSDALIAAEEATRVLEAAKSRFAGDRPIAEVLASHYLHRLRMERQSQRFGHILMLGESALSAIEGAPTLIELTRELALAVQAASDMPDSTSFSEEAQNIAVAAAQKAVSLLPEARVEFRNSSDFMSLAKLPAWQQLIENRADP